MVTMSLVQLQGVKVKPIDGSWQMMISHAS